MNYYSSFLFLPAKSNTFANTSHYICEKNQNMYEHSKKQTMISSRRVDSGQQLSMDREGIRSEKLGGEIKIAT